MREIEFRAWHKEAEFMFDVYGLSSTAVEEKRNGISYIYSRKDVVLMQYTGLKDKNGKKIYEGDMVKNDVDTGVVFWHEARAMFLVDSSLTDIAPMDDWDNFEVIGNIYDNPELLEGVK